LCFVEAAAIFRQQAKWRGGVASTYVFLLASKAKILSDS
jgi:hypothetical protein